MKKYLYLSILLMSIVGIAHVPAKILGYYDNTWYTDIIFHTIAGASMAYFWLFLLRDRHSLPRPLFYLTVIMSSVFGSYLWELWEFGSYHVVPAAMVYIPNLQDSLGDIACGLLGGTIVCAIQYITRRK